MQLKYWPTLIILLLIYATALFGESAQIFQLHALRGSHSNEGFYSAFVKLEKRQIPVIAKAAAKEQLITYCVRMDNNLKFTFFKYCGELVYMDGMQLSVANFPQDMGDMDDIFSGEFQTSRNAIRLFISDIKPTIFQEVADPADIQAMVEVFSIQGKKFILLEPMKRGASKPF